MTAWPERKAMTTFTRSPSGGLRIHYEHKPQATPEDPHGLGDYPAAVIDDAKARFDELYKSAKPGTDKPCSCDSNALRVYNVTGMISRTQCLPCGVVKLYTIDRPK